MKLTVNLSLFLFALVIFGNKSFSLTDHQIKKICKNEKNKSTCEKKLKEKRSTLLKGNLIEIPVIPYRRWLEFKFQILIQKD